MSDPALPARRARAHAAGIVQRLFGEAPAALRRRAGGLTNAVFEAQLRRRVVIVRMNAVPAKAQAFAREAEAIRLAHEHDIPVPRVLHVGADPLPHMVLARAPGQPAHRSLERLAIVRELGALAARIHRIAVPGFGAGAVGAAGSWRRHLFEELAGPQRIDGLERLGVLTAPAAEELRRTLAHMAGWRRSPSLQHGDLRLKNLLVDHESRITCVLDWENSLGSVAGLWDLSIALHDLAIDEKEMFVRSYGFKPQELGRVVPFLRLFNVLNYAPLVLAIAERGEGRRLGWQRARLAGHFDLF